MIEFEKIISPYIFSFAWFRRFDLSCGSSRPRKTKITYEMPESIWTQVMTIPIFFNFGLYECTEVMTWFPKPVLSFVFYEHWHRIDSEDLNVNDA